MRTEPEQTTRARGREREGAVAPTPALAADVYRVAYDEYRVKLYKVACRAAREQREQLRLEWEQHDRERD